MSFVVGLATKEYAIVMSDGRCRDLSGNIINEHYNKTKRIGQVIVGFSGETLLCEAALLNLKVNPVATVAEVSHALISYLRSLELTSDRKCNFVVIGPNFADKLEVHSFGVVTNLEVARRIPDASHVQFVTLASEFIEDGDEIVMNQLTTPHQTIAAALQDAISQVADKDPSVNKNVFLQEISLRNRLVDLSGLSRL